MFCLTKGYYRLITKCISLSLNPLIEANKVMPLGEVSFTVVLKRTSLKFVVVLAKRVTDLIIT